MPRKRTLKANKGLPERWRQLHGAYYYDVPKKLECYWDNKKLFRLGKTLPEAYKAWSERIGGIENAKNIGQLLDRYAQVVIPTKAPASQRHNHTYIAPLRKVFGAMPVTGIKPQMIYQYIEKRGANVLANREIKMFSHMFTKAVEWGIIDRHPFKGQVRLKGSKPRTRYIEDWEIVECLALSSPFEKGGVKMVQAYIKIKLLTGLRKGDLLRLNPANFTDEGMPVTTNKTGKPVVYLWTDLLRKAVAEAIAIRPVHISPFLFCTRRGSGFVNEAKGETSGWDSMWQRFMKRVLTETAVKERFTEHDLRAKCASDAATLDHAKALLTHADSRITERVYRRKPEKVMPLK
jgi:integrase